MPTYNGSRYLVESIESVLAQTEPDFEFIIVDDCSIDETPAILKRFASHDRRVRVLRNAVNQKLPRSLNVGFSHATGKYFTWTSDDNLFEPDALAAMARYLDENPEVGVVFSDYITIDEEGNTVQYTPVVERERLPVTTSNAASFLHRREVFFALGGYDPDWFLVEDFDFLLRAVDRFGLGLLRQPLYRYRVHPASLSETRSAEINDRIRRLLDRRLPEMSGFGKQSMSYAWIYQAERNYRASQWRSVVAATIRSFSISPYFGYRATKEILAGYWRTYWKTRYHSKLTEKTEEAVVKADEARKHCLGNG